MKVALFTREYPPEVYGGAGVHVEYLARELRAFEDVEVHAWGVGDVPHKAWDALSGDAHAAGGCLAPAVAHCRDVQAWIPGSASPLRSAFALG